MKRLMRSLIGHRLGAVMATLAMLLLPGLAQAQAPSITVTQIAGGLSAPVHITNAGDGSNRLFVVEQAGQLRIIKNGVLVPVPFLDITGRVLSGGEQGLLNLTFPPGYSGKGYFYVNYTRSPDGATVIARFRLSANPDIADPGSEEILLTVPQPFANHNGGQMAFGPDGFLYIGLGDGGSGGDPFNNAQNPGSLLGKILRIDTETPGCSPYCIPPGNPFAGSPTVLPEIWASGLRNPWRFSFDRSTGDLYIGDVGQGLIEEIDFQPAASPGGENYGWRIMEGTNCFNPSSCSSSGLVLPVFEYGHVEGNCSVTGGFVYRGPSFPQLSGSYLYGDFCSGRIWGLRRNASVWENNLLLGTTFGISSFGEDEAGDLYLADLFLGGIYKIVARLAPDNADNTGTAMIAFNNGLAVDFGGIGLWFYNGTAWSLLTSANPEALATYAARLVGDFGVIGLWEYNGTTWRQLTTANADNTGTTMVAFNGGIAVDFGSIGLWFYNGTAWSLLTSANPEALATYAARLVGDFGVIGLWEYNGSTWRQLTTANADNTGTPMIAFNGGIAVDFGGIGLWFYNGTAWSLLTSANPEALATYAAGLVGDFGAIGLWEFNGTTWRQLTPSNADNSGNTMIAFNTGLAVDFGPAGIWYYDGSIWGRLTLSNPEFLGINGANLVGDFGPDGLWNIR